jgi:hypothetical protein
MEEINQLRSFVRNVLLKIKYEQKQNLVKEAKEEKMLRKMLRKIIFETKKISNDSWILWPRKNVSLKLNEVKETAPHESTGINLLAKLLDNVIPVIETGYKNLTTDIIQRKSFRAHIMKATQNLLSTASVYFNDDDTLLHPDLWDNIKDINDVDFISFKQNHKNGGLRLMGNNINVGHIDSHNFIVNYNIIGDTLWNIEKYDADGYFAVECFSKSKNKIWLDKVLSTYNLLR